MKSLHNSTDPFLHRTRRLNSESVIAGPVIYWMNRDQRYQDNWALLQAQSEAIRLSQPLIVAFFLHTQYMYAKTEHLDFMLSGLSETARILESNNIPFILKLSEPPAALIELTLRTGAGLIVTDFSPLRHVRAWCGHLAKLASKHGIALWETDAHNIVPCWKTSDKQEYAARTIRSKINRQLLDWLTYYPKNEAHPYSINDSQRKALNYKEAVSEISNVLQNINRLRASEAYTQNNPQSGFVAAKLRLETFITNSLINYESRNNPNCKVTSQLSPYLNYGQISAQTVALRILETVNLKPELSSQAFLFLEDLIIRRELSDNYCFYNQFYDSFSGFPSWACDTLNVHRGDLRTYLYSAKTLLNAQTHDDLWNAVQLDLRDNGTMPGYLRMYWAKKLLEWSLTPEIALETAIHLNDSLALDGRDPNGYTGIAWSIGGTHDRPWPERSVFGKIRYMSYDGCKRKFSISDFIKKGDNFYYE